MSVESRSLAALVGVAGVVALVSANQALSLFSPSSVVAPGITVVSTSVVPSLSSASPDAFPFKAASSQSVVTSKPSTSEPSGLPSWTSLAGSLLAIPFALAGIMKMVQRNGEERQQPLVSIDDLFDAGKGAVVGAAVLGASACLADAASAYPIFAQQGFANPREATGRIVCANCHLASKKTEIEVPQAVLPDQVFEAVSKVPMLEGKSLALKSEVSSVIGSITFDGSQPVSFSQEAGIPVSQALLDVIVPATPDTVFKATIKVPYDQSLKQVGAKGKPADLNVGAVLVLPEGFTLAPPERIPEKMREEMKGLQFIQYSADQPNILVVGPVPGKQYEEMTVALLSPDPATNRNAHFGTLPVFVGGNRGRGQLYPTGEKSNNNPYNVVHAGKIVDIELNEKKRIYTIAIEEANGLISNEELPPGAELIVAKGDVVEAGQVVTTNPNVGGFGQAETEIVLQDPGRVKALLFFFATVLGTQTMLVVKKKQYEQVQLSEMNF